VAWLFRDRRDAGQQLAAELGAFAHRSDVVVLGLPRGGVPVAYEVARALGAPLDVFVVRKLGVPGHEEYAMGAIATGGVRILNDAVVHALGIPPAEVEAVTTREQRELERREQVYRKGRPPLDLRGRTVIVVDDGLATGASMAAAVAALRAHAPAQIVVATPVAAPQACATLRRSGVACVCVQTPEPFDGVGAWYHDFAQTSDQEVHALLRARRDPEPQASLVDTGPAR
jgi:predicted phosphoribosyltransferase